MSAHTTATRLSAAALAGGLTFGFGLSPASAMPTTDATSDTSVGALCQAAWAASAAE